MHKFIKRIGITFLFTIILSQSSSLALELESEQLLKPIIKSEDYVEINKEIVFDAKDSFLGTDTENTKFEWDMGDGTKKTGIETSHTYEEPGNYNVQLSIKKGNLSEKLEKEVFVYNKMIFMISDSKILKEKVNFYEEYAKNENILITLTESFNSATDFISQEILLKKLSQDSEKIEQATDIIIWTEENAGINALNRTILTYKNLQSKFANKNIFIIGDINSMDKQRLSSYFSILAPQKMIVVKESAIYGIIEYKNNEIKEKLLNDGVEFFEIDKNSGNIKIWNIMSYTINKLIKKGIPESSIVLILLLPVIVTILIFFRQIIGLVFPNIIYPTLISLTFLVIGLYPGIFIISLSSITIYLTKKILKNVGMLYTTKTGIVLIINSFLILLLIIFNDFLGLFESEYFSIAIIPALFLATITEQIIKPEKGLKKTFNTILQLLLICTIIYILIGGQISTFSYTIQFIKIKEFTLIHPEIIPLLLVFNVIIGKWTGLRLLERIRFKDLLKSLD